MGSFGDYRDHDFYFVGVIYTLAARINSFTAEPRSIERGQSATLALVRGQRDRYFHQPGPGGSAGQRKPPGFPEFHGHLVYADRSRLGGSDSRSVTVEVSTGPPPPPPPPPRRNCFRHRHADARSAGRLFRLRQIRYPRRCAHRSDSMTPNLLKRIFAADPSFTVVIEGHCDERGSAEYNLGLGDRRASAARSSWFTSACRPTA